MVHRPEAWFPLFDWIYLVRGKFDGILHVTCHTYNFVLLKYEIAINLLQINIIRCRAQGHSESFEMRENISKAKMTNNHKLLVWQIVCNYQIAISWQMIEFQPVIKSHEKDFSSLNERLFGYSCFWKQKCFEKTSPTVALPILDPCKLSTYNNNNNKVSVNIFHSIKLIRSYHSGDLT